MRYFLLLMLLIPIHTSYGQLHQNTNDKTFMASGDAILRVQPDQVVLSLGVESRGKELVATKNKNYIYTVVVVTDLSWLVLIYKRWATTMSTLWLAESKRAGLQTTSL